MAADEGGRPRLSVVAKSRECSGVYIRGGFAF
jgi:hypothetical protein